MNSFLKYQRTTGLITILSGILALGCLFAGAMAVDYNFDAFTNPSLLLNYSSIRGYLKLFVLLDMLGYYLLLLPVIFYLYQLQKNLSNWSIVFACCGLLYVFTGAIGCGLLTGSAPELMTSYSAASPGEQYIVKTIFNSSFNAVYHGLWNTLEVLLAGIWWTGTGFLLLKKYRGIGLFTIITGIITLLDSAGEMAGIKFITDLSLNTYLILSIIWAEWMGFLLYSKKAFAVVSAISG
jgi:hypothetical protein